jgi:spore germination protein YaaH
VAGAEAVDVDAAAPSPSLGREVFGFLPYWELNVSSTTLDFAKLGTLAYFGVGASSTGTLQRTNADGTPTVGWSGWTSAKLTSVINEAHANGTRVVLTVQSFAWSTGGANVQKALLGSSSARLNLARETAAAIRDRGVDGVNLDFEPIVTGYDDEFVALVRTLRAELNKLSPGYQLTFDATGHIRNYPLEAATAPGGADAVFIMGYDYRSAGTSPVGSIAPLTTSGYDIRETLTAYTARVPAGKLILGVPYYGRQWSTDTNAFGAANISGAKFGQSASALYADAMGLLASHGRRYHATEGVAWTAWRRQTCTTTYGCVESWRQVYFDDVTALKAKYDLVNQHDLRGVGIWALGYDDARPELWAALAEKFPPRTPFTDVKGTPFEADVTWLYFAGITSGCTASLFCPTGSVTRAEMASFLARALGLPAATRDYFADDAGSVHESDINRVAEAGVTSGCASGRYCPGARISRAEMASFLARALALGPSATDYFTDDGGSIHESNINRVAAAGIASGCATGLFCPRDPVTRGQMAAFLHRAFAG